ncbi:MAG: hypothetical protein ACD_81C00220G0002 [uncultured bacterium]|uniref:Putative phosphohydrolase n=1 Tax=Candidatus Wolfebacteria bacterium GW2011_GWC2_39_22 TaxID=1619013 RepID=A0A0G0RGS5_9BACT|nr:MAG: hypothetical protein ACD_81C00220G0002 [uncultured bacterium]KKR12862.1 MAG: putative phosphohydrolase [Candidatus Wolfebacteria bacterium GW2011_GWC2_39_22]
MELALYFFVGLAGVLLGLFLYTQNKEIGVSDYAIGFETLPNAFNGFRIVQLSDLHNKRFGKQQRYLIDSIRQANPDIIVMTGDLVDGIFYHPEVTLELIRGLRDVAPMYCVSGNHEWKTGSYDTFKGQLITLGVSVLDNRVETIVRNDHMLAIVGIDDYSRYETKQSAKEIIHKELAQIWQPINEHAFKILLAHRPERFSDYMEYPFSLIFSGHAHGGQWNLPILGPLFAPGQGLFPRLVSGIHRRHGTSMVISRGIGNSGFAFQRLFNKPEVVVVTLKKEIKK